MTATTSNQDFAKRMTLMAGDAKKFKPTATYDPDGDCIEFLAKPDPFYAERVDDLVTVYYSQETDELIGSLIKGVSKFCRELLRQMPGFKIEIQDRRVKLQHIFQARLWSGEFGPHDFVTLAYEKLIELSDDMEVDGVNGQLCLA